MDGWSGPAAHGCNPTRPVPTAFGRVFPVHPPRTGRWGGAGLDDSIATPPHAVGRPAGRSRSWRIRGKHRRRRCRADSHPSEHHRATGRGRARGRRPARGRDAGPPPDADARGENQSFAGHRATSFRRLSWRAPGLPPDRPAWRWRGYGRGASGADWPRARGRDFLPRILPHPTHPRHPDRPAGRGRCRPAPPSGPHVPLRRQVASWQRHPNPAWRRLRRWWRCG